MIRLFNSLTKTKEDFSPIADDKASIYSCGPTVYDRAHIGNLAAFIMADTLRRTFSLSGYANKHVMNFTDVDDKTISVSQKKFPELKPDEALSKLTRDNEQTFLSDIQQIGIDSDAIEFVRATDSIKAMQELIVQLHEKGIAYAAEDGIYFSLEKYKQDYEYGLLAHIDADSTSQARINNDEYDKSSVHDFALWKLTSENEPSWDFEFDGRNMSGRPGWHIECSAMSKALLGQPFDIHTGGTDLKFPHHENEIAQSVGASGKALCNLFLHNEHLLVDGKKMAKSQQNFHTLADIIEQQYDPMAFRMLVLQSHYRHQLNFSFDSLQAAQNFLNRLQAKADLMHQSTEAQVELPDLEKVQSQMLERLQDDLDTPGAIAQLAELLDRLNSPINVNELENYSDFIAWIDNAFGFGLSKRPDISAEQKALIAERETAREQKDYEASDKLRDKLADEGIEIEDTSTGPIWSRVSS